MRILVRATNWVGDAIMNLPALAAIVKNHPDDEVFVLAKPWVAPIFEAREGATGVISYRGFSRSAIREIRGRRFQKAFLFQNAFEAALLVFLAGVPERVGYSRDCRGMLLTSSIRVTREVKRLHHVDYYLNLLQQAGLPVDVPREPHLLVPQEALSRIDAILREALGPNDGEFVAVCPGAAFGPAKRWPEESFAKVLDWLWETRRMPAVLLGSGSEAQITRAIAEMTSGKCVDLCGKTALLEAAAVLSRASAVLTNDSGLMHLASAVGTPVAAIFASTDPTATRPLGDGHVVITSDLECSPCLKATCPRGNYDC
ncbi:lipopolysaccharide heptosyltransferase II, partial [bacterium]|nr:lipopolysaccharide heptosyltransferase II [bacterium]